MTDLANWESTRFLRGGCMGGRETGDSGGSLAAIFSPLGVPTSAKEVVNSVSISSSLLNHEKFRKLRKRESLPWKCVVQPI